jgi:hypothetical protein
MALSISWGILFGSVLTALLLPAPFHHIGFTWKVAWLWAIAIAAATGISAARSIGLF